MATPSRRTDTDLIELLAQEPYRFTFFQAVRLLERAAGQRSSEQSHARHPIGEDYPPNDEVVRFRSLVSLAFPAGEITSFGKADDNSDTPPQMTTSFLGLTGPAGVLPQHYTELLIERTRKKKDFSLRDFLDVFHHRLISLFYRSWCKYRFYIDYERLTESRKDCDLFTQCLFSLIGLGTGQLRRRQQVDDETFLYYGGHFAHAPRNAIGLETILSDYFSVPAQVLQFVGQWLRLEVEDQSSLPTLTRQDTCNNALGQSVIVGERVWGVENKFRIQIGPLNYREFLQFSPRGELLRRAAQLVRSYVGSEFDFDVQPVLRAAEVPLCQLGDQGDSYLGWNTWIRSTNMTHDAQDAVFVNEGWPGV